MPFVRRNPALSCACLCVIALSPALAGCGGKSSASSAATAGTSAASHATSTPATTTASEPPPPSSPAARAFIAQADVICREANIQLARTRGTKKQAAIAAAAQHNQAIEQKAVDRLAKLKPPAALSPAWQKMLLYRRSLARQLGVFASAVSLGVKSYGGLGASKRKLHAQLHEVASKAGFKDCAKIG